MVERAAPAQTPDPPWGDGCPSENDIAELTQGLVSPVLRAQVITHVDSCPGCSALLAELALVIAPAAPRRIGRYEVVEQIGVGGMGVVYLAVDSELKRRVALKLIRADLLDAGGASSIRARLVREAQLLAALTDPNVVAVHDVGEVDGDVFIAMEYVEGQGVSDWLREQSPGWRRILEAYDQAGRGLIAAHAMDIVHRDVKPSNLLVGADGRVRLTDFGLATIHRASTPAPEGDAPTLVANELPESSLTQAGTILGTPAYMAPEQHSSQAGPLADQFSFCLSLYEALTGARPILDRDHWKAAPSRRALGVVPDGIRDAVLRGLSLDPGHRFDSMAALLEALAVPPDAPSVQRRASSLRGAAMIAAALIVAGALIAGALLWRSNPQGPASAGARSSTSRIDAMAPEPAARVDDPGPAGLPLRPSSSPSEAQRPSPTPRLHRPRVSSPVRRATQGQASMRAVRKPPPTPKERANPSTTIPPLVRPLVEASPQKRRQAKSLRSQAYRHMNSGKGQACLNTLQRACKLDPRSCPRVAHIQALCEMTLGRCTQGLNRLTHAQGRWRRSVMRRQIEERAARLCPTGGSPRVRLWRLLGQLRTALRAAKPSGCRRHGNALFRLIPQLDAKVKSALRFPIYTQIVKAGCCLGNAGRCKEGWQLRFRAERWFLGKISASTLRKLQARYYRCASACKP